VPCAARGVNVIPRYRAGVGNLFTIKGRMKCVLSLAGRKINEFILKFYLYFTMRKSDFS